MDDTETIAAYVGLLRHELRLAPGTNALVELEARLAPPDPAQRPPARAPGIARLAKALKRLRQHKPPDVSLEQFSEDLRFLRAFEPGTIGWAEGSLDRLLTNVIALPPPRRRKRPDADAATNQDGATITPFRTPPPREDA